MRLISQKWFVAFWVCTAIPLALAGQETPGLSVHEGVLVLDAKPYRGIGVNYFSLFLRTLKDPTDTSYERGLARLSEADIPFARFMCGGFWPIDWDLYFQDKGEYYRRLDRVVRAAEKHNVGLIPSLFWHASTFPDLVGEPMDQLGNPESRTSALIRQYTEEVVTRYRRSRAIWGWEFGNEYNLAVDLPNASKHRPPVHPRLKTATSRTERDELSSKHMLTAFNEFARTVRRFDPHRIIITGNALPRPSAYHNTHERSWTPDTPEQCEEVLRRDNPDPFDTISIHVYPKEGGPYPAQAKDLNSLIETMQVVSATAGKPLFVGEFGIPVESSGGHERKAFKELLTAIETHDVPLSALWVFDFPHQDKAWNVTFENDRAWMLALISEANARMRSNNR